MTSDELKEQLYEIACSEDGSLQCDSLCTELIESDAGLETVDAILDYLGSFDDESLCCGGGYKAKESLMHFVERFSGRGYEQLLIESVEQRPRLLTIHMVGRAIRRERRTDFRNRLFDVLDQIASSFFVDDHVRECAGRTLTSLRSDRSYR
jgi:hypothetical protein